MMTTLQATIIKDLQVKAQIDPATEIQQRVQFIQEY